MSDLGDVAARLTELSDTDVALVVRQATARRPGLSSLHTAAETLTAGDSAVEPTESLPAIPGRPDIPPSPDVPPLKIPAAVGGEGAAYTAAGVPTLDGVRDKVERRLGDALGAGELEGETPAARSADKRWSDREKAGQDRLEEIRASLRRTIRPDR